MREGAYRWLVPFAALLAVLPLLLQGPSCGHDFDFHLLNWLEARQQLMHGGWPRWAFTPAFNAGEPRFLFYPPLSWLLGALLTALVPFPLVATGYTFAVLSACGFSMYSLARTFAPEPTATLAALVYVWNPYLLFTAYERTAYGELLAAVFLPLLFRAALVERPRAASLALPVALLWLTNAPAAVMGCYGLAVLVLCRLAVERGARVRVVLAAAGGVTLGLGLSAFYVVPAAYQQRFVQIGMAVIPGMTPADNFLFGHTADPLHDAVLHTASVVACVLLVCVTVALAAAWRRTSRALLLPLVGLAVTIAAMLTPGSVMLWMHLPKLAFLQFPWRLLALLSVVLGLGVALAARSATSRWRAGWLLLAPLLAMALILPAWHNFQQSCDAEDAPAGRAAAFHSTTGTEATDEYTPQEADADELRAGYPGYWLLPLSKPPASTETAAEAPPPHLGAAPAPLHLSLTLATPQYLVLNLREYPLWEAKLNGSAIQPVEPKRNDGLVTLLLPAGTDTVDLHLRHTPDELAGVVISCLSALAWVLVRRRSFTLG